MRVSDRSALSIYILGVGLRFDLVPGLVWLESGVYVKRQRRIQLYSGLSIQGLEFGSGVRNQG